jgi:hypothetical protein
MKLKTFQKAQTVMEIFKCWFCTSITGRQPNFHHNVFLQKISILMLFGLLFLLFYTADLYGQEQVGLFDTIHIERDGNSRFNYFVSNSKIKTISFQKSHFQKSKGDHFSIAGSVGRELLTVFTGIGTGATKDVNWQLTGRIMTDDLNLNWNIDIYCPGSISKMKERVRNNDGSFSTENSREIEINWEKSIGFITNNTDTISRFCVVFEPYDKPELNKWTNQIYKKPIEGLKGIILQKKDFALWGDFRGKDLFIICNSEENLLYLFKEKELRGIYQAEKLKLFGRKKNSPQPILLVKNTLSEDVKVDELLLSFVGQWFIYSRENPQ